MNHHPLIMVISKMWRTLSRLVQSSSRSRRHINPSARDMLQRLKTSTGLYPNLSLHTSNSVHNAEPRSTLDIIKTRISAAGPLTVSEYMSTVLTNPAMGYYMKKDVFGKQGDFITSPEISQMFGELLAVWIIHEWTQMGSPTPFQLVELGPGRGTLADDILRVFNQLSKIPEGALSLHLVEISPKLSSMQAEKLTNGGTADDINSTRGKDDDVRGNPYRSSSSKTGVSIHWYDALSKVPRGKCTCYIAHEFLDALPIHKFQRTDSGWREVLVDTNDDGPGELRFVLSAGSTPSSTVLIRPDEKRNHVEVSPQSGIVVEELSDRISNDGGMALVVDYGHTGDKEDTLRGFKEHRLHDVLDEPGTADLTADVDFSYLEHTAGKKVSTFGPVPQGQFLQVLGIQERLKMLLHQASPDQQTDLVSGYRMLVDPAQMGERFKMWAMFPQQKNNYIPAGFPP